MGDLPDHSTVTKTLIIKNNSPTTKHINFYSLCDCLVIKPTSVNIEEYSSVSLKISLTPEGYEEISRHLLVDYNGEKSYIQVYATLPQPPDKPLTGGCPECEKKERALKAEESAKEILDNWVVTDIYYSPGCKTCEDFINLEIPKLEMELSREVSVNKFNVLESKNLERLEERLKSLNVSMVNFPILIFENFVLQGDHVNSEQLKALITNKDQTPEIKDDGYETSIEVIKPLQVFAAGLIDGVNPCAFTTLLFLISSLFYIGRGKKEILQIGMIFSLTIFISYFLVGLGMLNIIRTANYFPLVSTIIRYILIVGLVLLALYSFYDAWLVKKGRTGDIKLQLPKKLKKRIHKTIKENTRKRGLITGTIIIGIMVTIFELSCTGQVYLPIIAYIIKIEGSLSAYAYLSLYNLAFILPLLIVFVAIYTGTTNQRLINWFQGRLFWIKVMLGLFFLTMIIFL